MEAVYTASEYKTMMIRLKSEENRLKSVGLHLIRHGGDVYSIGHKFNTEEKKFKRDVVCLIDIHLPIGPLNNIIGSYLHERHFIVIPNEFPFVAPYFPFFDCRHSWKECWSPCVTISEVLFDRFLNDPNIGFFEKEFIYSKLYPIEPEK